MRVLAALVRAAVADFPALHGGGGVLAGGGDEQAPDAGVGAEGGVAGLDAFDDERVPGHLAIGLDDPEAAAFHDLV